MTTKLSEVSIGTTYAQTTIAIALQRLDNGICVAYMQLTREYLRQLDTAIPEHRYIRGRVPEKAPFMHCSRIFQLSLCTFAVNLYISKPFCFMTYWTTHKLTQHKRSSYK
jgi:hypothetical protein